MPTLDEMARGYVEQIKTKLNELEKQLEVLRRHLEECEEEFSMKKKKESK